MGTFDNILSQYKQAQSAVKSANPDAYAMPPSAPNSGMYKKKIEQGIAQEQKANADIQSSYKDLESVPLPDLKNINPAPKQEYSDPFNAFKTVAPILAIFGSLRTRAPMTSAINSAAKAMESYHNGEEEKFKLERENWKDATEAALKQNQIETERYKEIIDKKSIPITAKMALISTQAKINGDWKMLAELQKGDYDSAIKQYELRVKVGDDLDKHTKELLKLSSQKEGALDDKSVDFMARQALSGDKSVFQNLGRGKQGANNIVALREKMNELAPTMGITPQKLAIINAEFKGLESEEKTLGTQEAKVASAAVEAKKVGSVLRDANAKVDRSDISFLGNGEIKIEKSTGDIPTAQLEAAMNSYINVYARAINPTGQGARIADKEHAREALSTALSKGQVSGVLDIFDKEVDAALASPGAARKKLEGGELKQYSPSEYKDAIKSGKLKKGDTFLTSDGVEHEVQ